VRQDDHPIFARDRRELLFQPSLDIRAPVLHAPQEVELEKVDGPNIDALPQRLPCGFGRRVRNQVAQELRAAVHQIVVIAHKRDDWDSRKLRESFSGGQPVGVDESELGDIPQHKKRMESGFSFIDGADDRFGRFGVAFGSPEVRVRRHGDPQGVIPSQVLERLIPVIGSDRAVGRRRVLRLDVNRNPQRVVVGQRPDHRARKDQDQA